MQLLYKSYIEHPKKVSFEGEDNDETVLLTLRKHFVTNLRWILITVLMFNVPAIFTLLLKYNGVTSWDFLPISYRVILFVFWYIFSFGYFLTSFLIWFYSVYLVSDKRLIDIDFHGFLHRRFSEAALSNIEDLTHQVSGFSQVVFHYGNVLIQTAGELRELDFESVPNPGKVQDFISDLAARKNGGADD